MTGRNNDERIREIISWIIDNEPDDEFYDPGMLYSRLEALGYSQEEISQAMLLLDADSIRGGILADDGFTGGTRILSTIERGMLSLEAQGWLLWLRSAGWISETHLSLIIESAGLEYRSPATLEEVKEISFRYVPSIPDGSDDYEYGEIN